MQHSNKNDAIPEWPWWVRVLLLGAAGGFILSMIINIATHQPMGNSYTIGFGIATLVVGAIFFIYFWGKRPRHRRTRRRSRELREL